MRATVIKASREAATTLASRLQDEGLGDMLAFVGFLDQAADTTPRVGTPEELAAGRGRGDARRRGHRPPGQAPPLELRGRRRDPQLRCRRHHARDPLPRHRHRAGDLRGHLARRPGGVGAGRARPACSSSRTARRTSATRTTSGSSSARPGLSKAAARSLTSTWSAGRTSWSSTATRSWSTQTVGCWRARRSSTPSCSWSTSTCPRHRHAVDDVPARDQQSGVLDIARTVISGRATGSVRADGDRSAGRATRATSPRSTPHSSSGCATTSTRAASGPC